MRTETSLLLAFLFFVSQLQYSQYAARDTVNIKKLKSIAPENDNKVYLKTKLSDAGNVHMFLINRSKKILRTWAGPSSFLKFTKEAKDTTGEWKPVDLRNQKVFCGTGLYSGEIWPNHYTWQTFLKKEYHGDFTTLFRFKYKLNDSVVLISNPQTIRINPDMFLPYHKRTIKRIDSVLAKDTLKTKHRQKLLRYKIRMYRKYKNEEQAIVACQNFVSEFPKSEVGKTLLASSYTQYLSKYRKELTPLETQAILSKAIAQWALIPANSKKQAMARRIEKHLKTLLKTKKEWLALPNNNYELVNGAFYSKLPTKDGELVQILFKEY